MQQLLSRRISQDANYVVPPNCVIDVHIVDGIREGKAIVKNNGFTVAILEYKHDLFDGECKFFENGDIHQRIFYSNGVINGWCSQYVQGDAVKYELYKMGTCLKIIVKVDNTESQWLVINPDTNEIVKIKDLKNDNMVETTSDGKSRLYDGKYNIKKDGAFCGFVRERVGIGYDNDLMYNGEWKNDVPNGKGTLFRKGLTIYSGDWHAGQFTLPDKRVYTYPNPILEDKPEPTSTTTSTPTSTPTTEEKKDDNTSSKPTPKVSPFKQFLSKRSMLQYIISGIILLIAIILIIVICSWCSWYNEGVDVTVCTKAELEDATFRMRSLTIPENCANDQSLIDVVIQGYSRLTYIKIGDRSLRYGDSLKIIDCPLLRKIEIGKEVMNNVPNWEKGNFNYDKSRVVKIDSCPELTSIRIGKGSFVAFDVFGISSMNDSISLVYFIGVPKLSYLHVGELGEDSSCFFFASLEIQSLVSSFFLMNRFTFIRESCCWWI